LESPLLSATLSMKSAFVTSLSFRPDSLTRENRAKP
jgi:hypothetical protein